MNEITRNSNAYSAKDTAKFSIKNLLAVSPRSSLACSNTEGLTNLTKPSPCGVHTRRVVSDENKQHETCNVRASEELMASARFGSVRS